MVWRNLIVQLGKGADKDHSFLSLSLALSLFTSTFPSLSLASSFAPLCRWAPDDQKEKSRLGQQVWPPEKLLESASELWSCRRGGRKDVR